MFHKCKLRKIKPQLSFKQVFCFLLLKDCDFFHRARKEKLPVRSVLTYRSLPTSILVLVLSILGVACNSLMNSCPQINQVCGFFCLLPLLQSIPCEAEVPAAACRRGCCEP